VVGDGTADSADNATAWAALATPIIFANGQELVLRGRVTLEGMDTTGDSLRWGVFDGGNFTGTYDPAIEPFVANVPASRSTTQPNGWLGFLASAAGTSSFEARNPASTQSTQFISTAGGGDVYALAGLGPADQTWDNDNNPGTEQAPMLTLAWAVRKAKPGVTFWLKPGTHAWSTQVDVAYGYSGTERVQYEMQPGLTIEFIPMRKEL